MNSLKYKPLNKKRHTKPCKFYQTMRCPQSAEECDFAHVLSDELVFNRARPCRYYLAGHCNNGNWCRYSHLADGGICVISLGTTGTPKSPEALKNARAGARTDGPSSPRIYIPSTPLPQQGFYSLSPTWPAYGDTTDAFANGYRPQQIYSPSEVSSISDDVVVITDDSSSTSAPDHGRGISPQEMHNAAHSALPPLYANPLNPAHIHPYPLLYGGYFDPNVRYSAHGDRGLHSRHSARPTSRHKLANYKTKPCKFFKVDGTCPNGDSCTFIHDAPLSPSSTSSKDDTKGEANKSPPIPSNIQHELPPKPVSVKEENKKKGYFPIPWRVIGGGVLIGGGKDRALSPESSSSANDNTQRGDSATPVEKLASSHCEKHLEPVLLEQSSPVVSPLVFPAASDSEEIVFNPKSIPVRTRAISIPTAQKSIHIAAHFSAESPGGL